MQELAAESVNKTDAPPVTDDATVQADAQQHEASEYESQARQLGWVPKDEFRGDPNTWKNAKDFVEHGERTLPILRDNLKTMLKKQEHTEKELAQLRSTLEKLNLYHQKNVERVQEQERKRYESRLKRIKEEKLKAAADGDTSAYTELDMEEDELRANEPRPQDAPAGPTPEYTEWLPENPWYDPASEAFDETMAKRAELIGKIYMAEHPRAGLKSMFKHITKEVKALYPDRFENPERKKAAAVDSSNKSGPSPRTGKSYHDLPPEDKKVCDEFCRDIPNFTREEYLKNYAWDEI